MPNSGALSDILMQICLTASCMVSERVLLGSHIQLRSMLPKQVHASFCASFSLCLPEVRGMTEEWHTCLSKEMQMPYALEH